MHYFKFNIFIFYSIKFNVSLSMPIFWLHKEVETICTFGSMFDTGKENFCTMFGWIKLSVLPLPIRAFTFLLWIETVQIDLLSPLCPGCPDIIEANVGWKIVDAIVPLELFTDCRFTCLAEVSFFTAFVTIYVKDRAFWSWMTTVATKITYFICILGCW